MPKGATKAQAKDQLRACEEMVAKGTFLPIKEVPKFSYRVAINRRQRRLTYTGAGEKSMASGLVAPGENPPQPPFKKGGERLRLP
jgi:hypothetical protein